MERSDTGLFIVIEGIDGTGKSTQAKMLERALVEAGHTVTLDREPSDGPFGKILRDSATTGRLSPQQELDLFHQDRKHHLEVIILPALQRGETVILDRYYFSTMAYQGQRGFDPQEIRETNLRFAPNPDILFILDLAVDQARERIGVRGDTTNEFEQRDALQYCRDTFLSVSNEKFAHVIDSSQKIDQIHQQMLDISLK
ncbi:MAG: dTMP kinase [Rubritalea sp.]|jgi:dTMP kinase